MAKPDDVPLKENRQIPDLIRFTERQIYPVYGMEAFDSFSLDDPLPPDSRKLYELDARGRIVPKKPPAPAPRYDLIDWSK